MFAESKRARILKAFRLNLLLLVGLQNERFDVPVICIVFSHEKKCAKLVSQYGIFNDILQLP